MFLTVSQIENAVLELLPSRMGNPFAVSGLVNDAEKKLKSDSKSRERLERETELILAGRDDLFFTQETCYPKEDFFQGTQFRIIPGRAELMKNILLYGARFAPFCSKELFPDEYTLSYGRKKCKVMQMNIRYADLAPAFLLLGHSGMIDCLAAESNENLAVLRASGRNIDLVEMVVSCYDMTDFYRENQFQLGDSILVTVSSWENGKFKLEYCPADKAPGRSARDRFLTNFESAMLNVCKKEHDSMEIPDQIAAAYLEAFLVGNDLRQTPDFSFDDYPACMQEISIRRDGPDWTFVSADTLDEPGAGADSVDEPSGHEDTCSCGEHHHHHEHEGKCCHEHHGNPVDSAAEKGAAELRPEYFSASSGTLGSLEEILVERDAPLNPSELHAYALDSMANGVDRFEDFYARISSLLCIQFADDAQEAAFMNFLEDDWEMISEYFNPGFEMDKSPLRGRLLVLCEQRVESSLRLLAHFRAAEQKVPENIAHSLARFHQNVSDTLSLFSMDAPLPEGEEGEQLELRVEDLEDAWDELAERIDSLIGDPNE